MSCLISLIVTITYCVEFPNMIQLLGDKVASFYTKHRPILLEKLSQAKDTFEISANL